MRACVVVGLVFALACMAVAGDAPRQRPNSAAGAFVSAELAGEVIKWQIDLGADAGKKTYEMTADVKVTYAEKDGVKQASSIRRAGGPDRPAREGTVVVKGKFVSAKLDGEKVLVTIKPAEGDKDLEVTLPKQLSVYYREEGGKLLAYGIGVPHTHSTPKAEAK
ncbi:MAG TPA: hypothetical protein VNE39_02335 [Planctomycetota bacterium]|nr:hypothetical protein [Planctomycetota bacterium]